MLDGVLLRGAPQRLHGRYRVVSGMRVYERVAPRAHAPVVVLLHGIGVSSRYFLPTAGRLAPSCSVHAPDLPGFGRSGRLGARPTVRRLADALGAWLDAAELEPDCLVAHSFGCQVAVDLEARAPGRLRRLVLVAPTADRRARSLPQQAARLALDALREPAALTPLQLFDYALHVGKSGVGGFAELLRDRIEEKLPHVAAPTLVVRGSRDPIVPHAWAREVADALPHGRLVEVEGAPHALNYTAPDELTRLTLEHLAQPAGPG